MIATDKNYLILTPGLDYEFIFEDLELAFTKEQLKRIVKMWNEGKEVDEIASLEKRKKLEIFLALIEQSRKRLIKRPFAYRRI